jgi:hypothetical protein
LLNGEVNLASSSGKTIILSGGQEMRPNAGGGLTVRRSADSTDVQITTGTAQISGSGEAHTMEAGSTATAAAEGPLQATINNLVVLSPGPDEEFRTGTESLPVRFSWTGGNPALGEAVRLEIAPDRRFSNIIHSGEYSGPETTILLGSGTWWWRIVSSGGASQVRSGRLTILRPPPVVVEEVQSIPLASPLVLAALSAETPISSSTVGALAVPALESPAPILASPVTGVQYQSPQLLSRPAGLYPPNGMIIDGIFLKANPRVIFSWNMTAGANAYICTIRQGDMVNLHLTREPHLLFDQLSTLRNGECIWQVEAVQLAADGSIQRHGEVAESRLTISVPKPDAPQINNPGIIYER